MKQKKIVLLENIRSAYNVGNIIRTADALGWDVWISGYTPSPFSHAKVKKTALGAEEHVNLQRFDTTGDAIQKTQQDNMFVIAAEVTENAILLHRYNHKILSDHQGVVVVFGNEVDGVLDQTLGLVDQVVCISMQGIKESLNVGQTSAMFMWEIGKHIE